MSSVQVHTCRKRNVGTGSKSKQALGEYLKRGVRAQWARTPSCSGSRKRGGG